MKALSLAGPWAELERRQREQEATIHKLNLQLSEWQAAYAKQDEELKFEKAKRAELETSEVPRMQNQLASAAQTIEQLMAEVERQRAMTQQADQSAAAAVGALHTKLEAASADNAVLKAELAKAVQLRQVTHAKVEEARRKLGLGQSEAEFFIKEYDDMRAANKALRAEVASLSQDKSRLEQQCDSRTAHAMTLITENKRLLEQVAELRRQVTTLDQDLWRTKQDLAAAQKLGAKAAKRREALTAANKARPEWQSMPGRLVPGPDARPGNVLKTGATSHAALNPSGSRAPNKSSNTAKSATPHATVPYSTSTSTSGSDTGGGRADQNTGCSTEKQPSGPRTTKKTTQAALPASAAQAVQEAAEQLEELRRAALQQALALRQQRLAQSASGHRPL